VKGELGEPLSSSFSITPTVAQWFSHVRNVLAGDVRCFTLSPLLKRVTGKVASYPLSNAGVRAFLT
jgi:hypothetical protein